MKNFDYRRQALKRAGWRREDRACGPNQSVELWFPPWDGIGYHPNSITFRSAWRRYLRENPSTIRPDPEAPSDESRKAR